MTEKCVMLSKFIQVPLCSCVRATQRFHTVLLSGGRVLRNTAEIIEKSRNLSLLEIEDTLNVNRTVYCLSSISVD